MFVNGPTNVSFNNVQSFSFANWLLLHTTTERPWKHHVNSETFMTQEVPPLENYKGSRLASDNISKNIWPCGRRYWFMNRQAGTTVPRRKGSGHSHFPTS